VTFKQQQSPKIQLPAMLSMPPKLLPILTEFNDHKFFLLEGGRGSAKTHTTARFLLYLASKNKIRVVCGREFQNSIEESVYTVLADLIDEFDLDFDVKGKYIQHRVTGSRFTFKGFRDQGKVNIKGLEGVDIVWIDEAQSVTDGTLEILVPTIRKENSKIIFTMNRYVDDDAVPTQFEDDPDCLHIHIDYFENPYCPQSIKIEAEKLKNKSMREYEHVYLGKPLPSADDLLFNFTHVNKAFDIKPFGDTAYGHQRVMGIDFAAQGNDQCVATILARVSNQHWQAQPQIAWDEDDAMVSVGKIVQLIGQYKPTVAMLDVGGMGHVVHNRLVEVGVNIDRFDGATTDGIDVTHYVNKRAHGYYALKDWLEQEWLILDPSMNDCAKELKKIRMKFRSDGRRLLQSKADMKKDLKYSPDRADSLMMAVWAAITMLGNPNLELFSNSQQTIKRITKHKQIRPNRRR